MKTITEQTLLPLSLVGVLIGGVFWFSNLWAISKQNSEEIKEIKSKQEEYVQNMYQVNQRLSRIEGALGVKNGR